MSLFTACYEATIRFEGRDYQIDGILWGDSLEDPPYRYNRVDVTEIIPLWDDELILSTPEIERLEEAFSTFIIDDEPEVLELSVRDYDHYDYSDPEHPELEERTIWEEHQSEMYYNLGI